MLLGVTLHCTFVYRRSGSIASSVIVDFLRFSPLVLFGMSSKSKAKRKNKCPGCGTPKEQHDFAVMGKNCDGPAEEPDPDCEINQDEKSDKHPVLLLLTSKMLYCKPSELCLAKLEPCSSNNKRCATQ